VVTYLGKMWRFYSGKVWATSNERMAVVGKFYLLFYLMVSSIELSDLRNRYFQLRQAVEISVVKSMATIQNVQGIWHMFHTNRLYTQTIIC
jgi:hypothetical protein